MPSAQNAAVAEVAPITEELWYVAIDDETVGPFSFAEMERRARDGELDAEQLIWSEGMSDWLPAEDLPQFASLMLDAPAEPDASSNDEPITWQPQAAADLASLVEQVRIEPPAEPKNDDESDPFIDLPPMAFVAPAAASWGVPSPEPQDERRSRAPMILFGALTVVGCIAGVLVGLHLADGQRAEVAEEGGARDATARVAPDPVVSATPPAPEEPEPATEIVLTPAPVSVTPPPPPADPDPEPRRVRRRRTPPPPAEPQITKAQIKEAVFAQRAALKPCVRNAISARELAPGQYGLVASWVIGPKGKLLKPRIVGPSQVLRTSLPACAARVMREWAFPAPGVKAPVNGFPLANVRVR